MDELLSDLSLLLNSLPPCELTTKITSKFIEVADSHLRSKVKTFPVGIKEIDVEILLNLNENRDLIRCLSVNKYFVELSQDEFLWQSRIKSKYNLNLEEYTKIYNVTYKFYCEQLMKKCGKVGVVGLAALYGWNEIFNDAFALGENGKPLMMDELDVRRNFILAVRGSSYDIIIRILNMLTLTRTVGRNISSIADTLVKILAENTDPKVAEILMGSKAWINMRGHLNIGTLIGKLILDGKYGAAEMWLKIRQ